MTLNHFPHVHQPADPGKPTLLLLHGTGGNEHDLLQIAEAVAPGHGILSPRGLVSEHGAPRWFRRLAEGVFDLEDLKFRTNELQEWLELARQEYKIETLDALGYSNGANMAANLVLQGYNGFRRAVLLRPMFTDTPNPQAQAPNTNLQLHIGENDPICPPGSAGQLAQALQTTQAQVITQTINAAHNLTQADILYATDYLAGP